MQIFQGIGSTLGFVNYVSHGEAYGALREEGIRIASGKTAHLTGKPVAIQNTGARFF